MFTRRMVLPYTSLYIIAVGGKSAQIGLVNSLRPIAGLLIFPLSGYLTDRAGRVKLIALAGYLSAASMLLYVFAPSWEWIALGALLQGFMVFQFPPTSAILADSLDSRIRGTGVATMNTVATAFSMFSPYIAGILLEIYTVGFGMRILFGLLVITNAVNATLVYRFLKETSTNSDEKPLPDLGTILKESYLGIFSLILELPRPIKALGIVVAMGFIANSIASPFWVVYVVEEIGLSNIDWGLILLIETVFKTILTIPAGMLVDRYGRTKGLLLAVVVSLVSMPTIILARGFMDVLVIRLAVAVAGALFLPASTALMADYTPTELRGRVMAALGRGSVLVGATGGGTGGPGMGYLFTIPVIIGSLLGGILYAMNPAFPWYCLLFTIIIQVLALVFFINDPLE
jgi:MFS family permease